jgi:hypothetical protein
MVILARSTWSVDVAPRGESLWSGGLTLGICYVKDWKAGFFLYGLLIRA